MPKMQIFAGLLAILAGMSLPVRAEERADWPPGCKLERLAQVPMSLVSGHASVPVSIGGKDFTMVVDTAGPESSLTIAASHRLGFIGLESWHIGDFELDNIHPRSMAAFPGADGLIAPAVLNKYDVEFDFGGNKFSLFKHHPCANYAAYWVDSAAAVPFALTPEGHIRVSVTLDGKNMRAVLDTGAPISLLGLKEASSMFGLTPDSTNVKAADSVSGPWTETYGDSLYAFSATTAYSYPFKAVTIGSVTVMNPHIELIKGGYDRFGRNFLGSDYATLLIGNDVLSRFHLYVAYQEQKLYITDAQAH